MYLTCSDDLALAGHQFKSSCAGLKREPIIRRRRNPLAVSEYSSQNIEEWGWLLPNERRCRTMDQRANEIPIGIRFRMSELGGIRCPRLAQKVGTVVGRGIYKNSITVLFDGNKSTSSLHRDYIVPIHAID